MPSWTVKITAPNGAIGHFEMAAGEPTQRIVDFFAGHVMMMEANDPEALKGIEGVPPERQSEKKAR